MQAFEFYATAQNGIIQIPDEYVKKVGLEIRVILISEERSKSRTAPQRRSLNDMIGALKDCGDMNLHEIRMERLQKYESFD